MILMGVDIGTSSVKVSLLKIDEKNRELLQVAEGSAPLQVIYREAGWVEQNPSEYVEAAFTAIKEALGKAGAEREFVAGIGVSAQCPTLVILDKAGNPLARSILYMDRRSEEVCRELSEALGEDRLFELTKNAADPYFAGYKLIWIARNMEKIYRDSSIILSAGQFLVYKLTAGVGCIDWITACTFAPFYDWDKRSWNESLLQEFGLDPEKLPQSIYPPYEPVGELSSEAAEKTGLKAGTPVIIGTCDAQAGALASGALSEGDSIMVCGTTHLWEVIQSHPPRFSPKLINAPYIFPNLYLSAAALLTTGAVIEWLVENLLSAKDRKRVLVELEEEARKVSPGADGLVSLPYFMGERSPIWDPHARGLILGLTLKHKRAHVYRALLEGVALALRSCKEVFDSLNLTPRDIIAVNGAAKNRLWMEIIADALGIPIKVPKVKLGSASGAALLAGYGLGVFKRPEDLKQYLAYEKLAEPREDFTKRYEEMYSIYAQLYPLLRNLMHRLSKLGAAR